MADVISNSSTPTSTNWTITLVDTGAEAYVGERLWAVRDLVQDEEAFMCNYADCLTDCHLPTMTELHVLRDPAGRH